MNIAIIGSNGFIGRHLTELLINQQKHRLFLFGRSKTSFFERALPYEILDQANAEQVKRQFKDIDLVYYLASSSIPASSWQLPHLEIEQNLSPFVKFLEALESTSVKKICFVSSAGTIYGPSTQSLHEDAAKHPFSPYGITKLSMEYYLNYFKKRFGLEHTICRVSNVYGAGQNTGTGLGLINTFLEKISRSEHLRVFGDGNIIRNYIYVKDVAWLLDALSSSDLQQSGTYNIASNDNLSINEVIALIKSTISQRVEIDYVPARESDNSAIVLDNGRIRALFPNFTFTEISTGIKETFDYILHQEKISNE